MKFVKNKLAVTIIVLSVTFLGLIIYSTASSEKDFVSGGVGTAVNPLQKMLYNLNSNVKEFVDLVLNFSEVKEENKQLKDKNTELETKLTDYNKYKEENDRLRTMVDLQDITKDYTYEGCNVIGFSGGNYLDGYIIDKGENHGIGKGMVVVHSQGLVGQVTSVGSNWAIVQSIYNQNIAVAIMVEGSRDTGGILRGYRDGTEEKIKVDNLSLDSKIAVGDTILTSGLGFIYPKEIRIGKVVSVESDEVKVMKSAIIEPFVDFNKLEELYVMIPKEKRDVKYD